MIPPGGHRRSGRAQRTGESRRRPRPHEVCQRERRSSCSAEGGMAKLIHEHSTHIRTPDGQAYLARTYGELQADRTWIGWLEFQPIDKIGPVLRTDRET